MKTIFLLEKGENVKTAIEKSKFIFGNILFISLRPEASYELEKSGVIFKTRNDYFDSDTANTIGRENDKKIENISSLIDDKIHKKYGNFYLKPANDCFVSLKILFDVVAIDAAIIHTIIEREKPTAIHVFSKPANPTREKHLPFSTNESVYTEILLNSDWGIQVICEDLVIEEVTERQTSPWMNLHTLKKMMNKTLHHHNHLFDFLYVLDRKGLLPAFRTLYNKLTWRKGNSVILYGGGYNWDDSLEQLSFSGISNIIRLEDSEFHREPGPTEEVMKYISDVCQNIAEIRSCAIVEKTDLSKIIFPKIAFFIANSLIDSLSAYETTCNLIRDRQIHTLLLSTRDTPKGGHIIRAARDMNIPVISWQHGGAGYFDLPLQMYSELKGSDVHLVFGDGVKNTFEQTCKNHPQYTPPAIISVGSSSLENLHVPAKKTKRDIRLNVVYISTVYHNNMYYYPFRTHGGDFDESLWNFQRKMLDLAKHHTNCDFTIKLYPSHITKEPLQSYSTDHSCNNVKLIVQEKTVAELLGEADILVFDIVTTAILQALTTEKEIFVFTGIYQPEKDAMRLLKKRAHAFADAEVCIQTLSNYLKGYPLDDEVDPTNTEFLQSYGTYLNDGKSSIRAASIVKQFLEMHDSWKITKKPEK
jgi:hypothetical protein